METYKAYFIAEELADGSPGRPIGHADTKVEDEAVSMFMALADAKRVFKKLASETCEPIAIFIVNLTPVGKLVDADD